MENILNRISLISKSIFLTSSLLNIGAMEGKNVKLITLEEFCNCTNSNMLKDRFYNIFEMTKNNIKQCTVEAIKTYKDVSDVLENNKKAILCPIISGAKIREEAYYLGLKLIKYLEKYYKNSKNDKISEYRILKLKKKKDDNDIKKLDEFDNHFYPLINNFKNENKNSLICKIDKNFDFSKLLCVSEVKNYNDNQIKIIGRYILKDITPGIYKHPRSGKDKILSEFKRAKNGEMNCTINSTLIYTFLKLNGFNCYLSEHEVHEFVLINYRDEINKKIVFSSINLIEEQTIDDMCFDFMDIIKEDSDCKIWDGMFNKAKSDMCIKDFEYKNFTPTYMYYKGFMEACYNVQDYLCYDVKLVKYYLNGLKSAVNYLIKEGHTNGKNEWKIRFSPRKGNVCKFILNLDDLGEPEIVDFKYNDKDINQFLLFKSKKDNSKYTNYIETHIHLPRNWRDYLGDGKIKIGEPDLKTKTVVYEILNKDNKVVEKGINKIHVLTIDEILNIVGINKNINH